VASAEPQVRRSSMHLPLPLWERIGSPQEPKAIGWTDLVRGAARAQYPSNLSAYSFISISRNVNPNPDSANALLGSLIAGTETRFEAAKTAVWSCA
jgi:hypothetical protein